jgi:hypothetical protein
MQPSSGRLLSAEFSVPHFTWLAGFESSPIRPERAQKLGKVDLFWHLTYVMMHFLFHPGTRF